MSNPTKQNHALIAALLLFDLGLNDKLSNQTIVDQLLTAVFTETPLKIDGDERFPVLAQSASIRASNDLRAALEGRSNPSAATDDKSVQPRGCIANRSRGGGAIGARGGNHHLGQRDGLKPKSALTEENIAAMLAKIKSLEMQLAAASRP